MHHDMQRPLRHTCWTAALAVASLAASTAAQVDVPAKFSNLRFEEDWSALTEPEVTTNHRWPDIKNQDLGGGWTASYGGQFRYRVHYEHNKSLMDISPTRNSFSLYRTRVHADIRHRESGWRVFVEGLDARISGNDFPPLGIDRNALDLQNAFVEKRVGDVTLRVGRMELQEGAQRLISPLDWANTRRKFDGALVRFEGQGSKTDVFVARPVGLDVHGDDDGNDSLQFGGIYTSYQTEGGTTFDAFGLVLDERDPLFMGDDGIMGDRKLYTVGGRMKGKQGSTDYELWAAAQFGEQATNDIHAYSWEARMGQSFPDSPLSPRVGLDVLFASGDDDPTDGETNTFNQLFPLGHAYLGYLDLVGRQNIIDISPNVTAKINERTSAKVAWHKYTLANEEDALYTAGGGATFADPSGASSDDVGDELDVTVSFRPEFMSPHSHILVGWSRFFAGQRMDDLGGSEDADLFYLQYTLTF